MKEIDIVAVSGDPGGAEAIAPVLTGLCARGAKATGYAYRQARAVWTEQGFPFEALPDQTDAAACAQILERHPPDLLLTATSVNGVNLESKFIAAARRLGIPSLAVLDMWTNYRRRFSDDSGRLAFLPDRIAVMDERAREEMIAEGIDGERLVVTGQPAFEEIASWKATTPGNLRQTLRLALGVPEANILVVFGSQPISAVAGSDISAPNHIGYTERTVLPLLIESLEGIANFAPKRITLLVRPHPRETEESYSGISSSRISVLVSSQFNRREIALAADAVVGMNSAFLIESSCLGTLTVSLQPGLRQPDSLPTGGYGIIHRVYDPLQVQPTLERLLLSPKANADSQDNHPEAPRRVPARENVISLICRMIHR